MARPQKSLIVSALLSISFFFAGVLGVHAQGPRLPFYFVMKTDFKIWEVNLEGKDLLSEVKKAEFLGLPIAPEDPEDTSLASYFVPHDTLQVDLEKVRTYLKKYIAPSVERPREDVTIRVDGEGKPVFEGFALYGRKLDLDNATLMMKEAIERGIDYINLPLLREEPRVTIAPELQALGIRELFSSAETDFTGSHANRIHNITVGLRRFQGYLLPPGKEFVFGNVLGEVSQATGFLEELVIKGDRTIPEYGGGLCQVSTTAFRAALFGGLPITQRINHSFAVSYYSPIGLDATVYPPSVDLKFVNDTSGALLVQTLIRGHNAYFNYYGTRDDRRVALIGPFYSNRQEPPPPRTEYTEKLAPGETEKLGNAVPGLDARWYRQVVYKDPSKKPLLYTIFSKYQARPLFTAIGTAKTFLSSDQETTSLQEGF